MNTAVKQLTAKTPVLNRQDVAKHVGLFYEMLTAALFPGLTPATPGQADGKGANPDFMLGWLEVDSKATRLGNAFLLPRPQLEKPGCFVLYQYRNPPARIGRGKGGLRGYCRTRDEITRWLVRGTARAYLVGKGAARGMLLNEWAWNGRSGFRLPVQAVQAHVTTGDAKAHVLSAELLSGFELFKQWSEPLVLHWTNGDKDAATVTEAIRHGF